MYHAGIISQPSRSLVLIQSILHQSMRFQTHTFTQPWRAANALQDLRFDALIIHTEKREADLAELSRKIREYFKSSPLLFVTRFAELERKVFQPQPEEKVCLLNFDSELYDIPGILSKMITGQEIVTRAFRRFPTAQNAAMTDQQKNRSTVRLLNLGLKGAQVRVFDTKIKVGDEVNLHVPLMMLGKEYWVPSKVVWARDEREIDGQFSQPVKRLGLQFTRSMA